MGAREVNAGKAVVEIGLRDKATAGLVALERRMSSFGRNVATFGASMAAVGVSALAWPLKLSADMEQTSVAFEVMVGDATKAKKLLEDLQKFAAQTPFGFAELADAGKMLMSYGVTADNVMGTLKLLGDVSGGNAEKLQRLTLAYGQVQAKGRLMGGEVIQMVENGFNPLQEISRTTGKTVAQLTKEMENGGISAAMVTQAFMSATASGGRFHGMMDKQSQTLWGLWSALMDNISMAAMSMGDALLPILKPMIETAIGLAQALRAFIERNQTLARWVGIVLMGLTAVGGALVALGLAAMAASTIFGMIASGISFVVSAVATLFSPVGLVAVALVAAGVAAWTFRDRIAEAFAIAAQYMAPLISAVYAVWDAFSATFNGVVAALMSGDLTSAAGIAWLGFVATAWTAIAEFGTVIQTALTFLEAWIPGVGAVRDSVVAMFAGIGNAILAGRWDLAGAILMAKIQLNVAEGWARISNIWAAASTGIGTIWDMMVYGIRTGWHAASTGIAAAMLWVAEAISNYVEVMKTAFLGLVTVAQGVAIAIKGVFTGSTSSAIAEQKKLYADFAQDTAKRFANNKAFWSGARGNLFDDAARTQKGIGADYEKSVTGRVEREQATRAANAARVGAAQAGLADLEAQAAAARGGITASDRAKSASEALNKALAAAQDERENAKGPDGLKINAPKLAAAAGKQLDKIESRGTFSAAAALTFGARSNAPEETARNTGRAARLLQVIADKPGPQFT